MNSEKRSFSESLASFIIKARRQFFKFSMREKILILLFVVALLGIWMSMQFDRIGKVREEIVVAHGSAKNQLFKLGYKEAIDQKYERLISEINLDALPSKDEVNGQIDALVRSYGFGAFDLGQPQSEEGDSLLFHSFSLAIQKVTYPQIKRFAQELKSKLPHVSLERISLRVQSNDDNYLNARLILKSIEHTK